MTPKALSGIKVLEFAEFVSGPYCAKLMADLGAEVIKIEKPGCGDEARRRGPFPGDVPDTEKSGLFLYLNTNKAGVTLDPSTNAGKKIFLDLVRQSDILVENYPVGTIADLGLDYETLKTINPHLVMTSIAPFGQTGPHSKYKSYYLNTFHAGGEAYTLPGGIGWLLYSDRPPIKAGGFVGEYNAGVAAALASLGAVYGVELTGEGRRVDISEQEVLLGLERHDMAKCNYGWVESRATRSYPMGGLMECKDGFVQVIPLFAHMWTGLIEAMGSPEWGKEERFEHTRLMSGYQGVTAVSEELQRDRDDANRHLEEWISVNTKEDIYKAAQAKGCIAGKVSTAEDLMNSEQLRSRGFFTEADHPRAGRLKYAGSPYKFSETPWKIESAAPLLGQHNEQVYCGLLGYSKEDLVRLRGAGVI